MEAAARWRELRRGGVDIAGKRIRIARLGSWVVFSCEEGGCAVWLVDPDKGGWGGWHHAGSTTDRALASVKMCIPSRGTVPECTVLLEAMAALACMRWSWRSRSTPRRCARSRR